MTAKTIVVTRKPSAQVKTSMNQAADSASKAGSATEAPGEQVHPSGAKIEQAGQKVTDLHVQEQDAATRLNTAEKKLDEVKRSSKPSASQMAQAEEGVLTSRNSLEKATEGLVSADRSHTQAMKASAQQAGQSSSKLQELDKRAEETDRHGTPRVAFSPPLMAALSDSEL